MKKLLTIVLLLVVSVATGLAQIDTSKEYRIKDVATGNYLNAANHPAHATGPIGGVTVAAYAESDDRVMNELRTLSGKKAPKLDPNKDPTL